MSEASRAGVKIDLIVRGICCVLPGIKGETENLTVTSIVGRYLEHPRVFVFGAGTEQKVYIGSADMMTRNTEKRVEVACPILNQEIKKRLIRNLHVMLADNVKARVMNSDDNLQKEDRGKSHQFAGNLYARSSYGKTSGEETTETDDFPENETAVSERIEQTENKQKDDCNNKNGKISIYCRKAQCGAGICESLKIKRKKKRWISGIGRSHCNLVCGTSGDYELSGSVRSGIEEVEFEYAAVFAERVSV